MKKLAAQDALAYGGIAVAVCVLVRGWDAVFGFLGIVLSAIMPLVLGAAIAYVVSIPTNFLERHILPNSTSRVVADLRKPVSLAITLVALVMGLLLSSYVLVPALVDTVTMVQKNGEAFVEDVIQMPIFEPVRGSIQDFIDGQFMQELEKMDIGGLLKSVVGGNVGSVTTQLFTVVSTVMTAFFGMIFSLILLTDTTDVGNRIMRTLAEYMGPKRTEQFALLLGVADTSFHNFFVRQCVEALILGTVGTLVLVIAGFPYALGVGVLQGLAALVPIVGYPVGLCVGAFMVVINNPWCALYYVICVALAQVFEATFVLPHVGDPRTVLPPVWITVGVTIGGGVAGFLGMLLAIPTTATLRQLVLIDMKRRQTARKHKQLVE